MVPAAGDNHTMLADLAPPYGVRDAAYRQVEVDGGERGARLPGLVRILLAVAVTLSPKLVS